MANLHLYGPAGYDVDGKTEAREEERADTARAERRVLPMGFLTWATDSPMRSASGSQARFPLRHSKGTKG